MNMLGSLQRQAFEYLKRHIKNPNEYDNFTVHTDTCDIQTVAFFGKKKGCIKYKRSRTMYFFWSNWECTISIDSKTVTEKNAEDEVMKDIIEYQKQVRINDAMNEMKKHNKDKEELDELFSENKIS